MKTRVSYSLLVLLTTVLLASCAVSDPNLETAKLNMKNGDYEKAVEAVNQAITNNPENADAYLYKGEILQQMAGAKSDPSERSSIYGDMTESYNKAIDLYNAAGTGGKSYLAEVNIARAWTNEHNAGVKLVAGKQDPSEAEINKASQHLENAVKILPDSTKSLEVLAEVRFMAQDYAGAAKVLQQVIEKDANVDAGRYSRLVTFLQADGQIEESLVWLKKGREVYPENIDLVQTLTNTYLKLEDTENAIATVKELIASDPNNPQYYMVYGIQLYRYVEDLTEKADANYDQLFELKRSDNSGSETAKTQIKKLEDENEMLKEQIFNYTDDAVRQLKNAAELKPTDDKVVYTIGTILQNKAAAYFKKRDNTEDNDAANALDAQGRETLEESLTYYEKASEIAPDNQDYWRTLFRVYTTLGMTEKATEAMEKAGM